MSDFNYIDSYFKGELPLEETRNFELKIREDAVFAEEVAFYCSAMQAVKDQLAEEKRKQFRKIYDEGKFHDDKVKPMIVKKLWPSIAAAAVVAGLIFGLYMYSRPSSPGHLADQYIKQHFQVEMGVKMAAREDSLDAAMQLYNEGKLPEALLQFEKIIQTDSTAEVAKRMAGIVSLRMGEYDKALDYFTQLENLNLYTNPGKLYHAISLIKRNRPGDNEMVKQLLQQVIEKNLEGKETAQKWLKSF
jgi:tetratricopeptide (TPR) repeat protein